MSYPESETVDASVEGSDLHVGNEGAAADLAAATTRQQQQVQAQPDGATAEEVAHATRLGWSPKEDWVKRNPGREHLWRGAKAFIEYGEQNRPVLVGEVRKLSDKIAERDRRIGELEAQTGELRDFVNKTQTAIMERRRNDLLARKKAAREANDFEGEMAVDDEMKKLETAAPAATTRTQGEPPPAVKQFMADNPWYGEGPNANEVLTYEYIQVAKDLAQRGLRGQDLLDKSLAIIKKRYPDDFKAKATDEHRGNGAGNGTTRGSAVDTGGFSNGQQQTRTRAPTFDNLPAEAKREAIKFEQRYKVNRESYAKQCLEAYGADYFTGSPGDAS